MLGGGCGAGYSGCGDTFDMGAGWGGGGGGQYNISGTMDVDSCLKVHKHENFFGSDFEIVLFYS